MCYVISLVFYLIFYLFAMMMQYIQFQIFDFILFFLFLLAYRFVIMHLNRYYFIADGIASALIVLFYYAHIYDASFYLFFYLMYFIALESFTYTYLDISKYHNSLTKS